MLSSNLFPAATAVLAGLLAAAVLRSWVRRRRLTVERTVGAHHRALDGLARSATPGSGAHPAGATTAGDPGWGPGVILLDSNPVKARHPARPKPEVAGPAGRTHVRVAAPGGDVSQAS